MFGFSCFCVFLLGIYWFFVIRILFFLPRQGSINWWEQNLICKRFYTNIHSVQSETSIGNQHAFGKFHWMVCMFPFTGISSTEWHGLSLFWEWLQWIFMKWVFFYWKILFLAKQFQLFQNKQFIKMMRRLLAINIFQVCFTALSSTSIMPFIVHQVWNMSWNIPETYSKSVSDGYVITSPKSYYSYFQGVQLLKQRHVLHIVSFSSVHRQKSVLFC